MRSGLTRQELIERLANDLQKRPLLPLLWLLPRQWRLGPAQLPQRLQALGGVLERGLLNPLLLAALADDLPHLFPSPPPGSATALDRWCSTPPATTLAALLCAQLDGDASDAPSGMEAAKEGPAGLAGGLVWQNRGLGYAQSAAERERNACAARLLNRLGANLITADVLEADGCITASGWVGSLSRQGWQVRGRLRASVASFGLGAAMPNGAGGWSQIPLGLPIRTGLLDAEGNELQALLPHSCLELEMIWGTTRLRLQYYQGSEGLCGWEGLNDLHRAWQNDPDNGTVRYLGEAMEGDQLAAALDLCDVMALLHNQEANARQLQRGGYGTLGFCIDSSALIQQALHGRCDLFPVLLGGIWRERLQQRGEALLASGTLASSHRPALERYLQAIEALPLDLAHQGGSCSQARQRLLSSQPLNSPFQLVGELQHRLQELEGAPSSAAT